MYPFHIGLPLTQEEVGSFIEQHRYSVVHVDGDGTILSANSHFRKSFGYSHEPSKLEGLLGEDEGINAVRDRFESNPSMPIATLKVKAGTGMVIEVQGSLYKIDSPRLRSDQYLLSLHGGLPDQQPAVFRQFSDTFMRDVNLGILLISSDYTLVEISAMACRVLGLQREKVTGQDLDDVFRSIPTDHQFVQRSLLDGLTVKNHALSWTNNQERYELLMDANLLKDDQGEVLGAYIIFKDVTNIRSLEEQVQRSDRLAMIGQIAAGTAHEIRNPLTSIKGFLQVLKKTMLQHELKREFQYTEIMLSEIDRINELVSEFLLLSKPKNSIYHQVDVSAVIRDILPIINNEAILHDVTVQYEAALNLPPILGDRELLKQVYINICKNGIEAMADGGILTITERLDEEERKIHIDIRDTGPGIPGFLIDKIFDPFFTTKEEGTGLGLSVCQRIVHDMNGLLRVSSKGYGTTFTISIPYHR